MTSITWAGPRCVQGLAAILGPQNRTQGRSDNKLTIWSVQLQVNGMPSERDHWPPHFHRFHPWQMLNDVSRQLISKVIDRIGRMSGTRKFESECTRVIFTFILFDLFIENVIFCRNYLLHHNDVLSLVAELQKLFHSARRDHLVMMGPLVSIYLLFINGYFGANYGTDNTFTIDPCF